MLFRRPAPAAARSAPSRACHPSASLAFLSALCLAAVSAAQPGSHGGSASDPVPTPPDAALPTAPRGERAPIDAGLASFEEPAPKLELGNLPPFVRDQVWTSDEVDGTRWARGADYKAGFGPTGTSYIPFFGSRAPRNFPVVFRLAQVTVGGTPLAFEPEVVPSLEGGVVRYDRGSLLEAYELELGSVEQTFVFDSLPSRGELVVRISTESELEGRELPERIEFGNELGAVRYGRATALDADGKSVSAPTALTEHGIEIRVPQEFVEAARFPLVIDPVFSTFSLDTAAVASHSPDCAYDVSTSRWLIVSEELFSQTDHDVEWRLISVLNPATIAFGYLDTSLAHSWIRPSCANNNAADTFFVGALVSTTGASNTAWAVKGRTLYASGTLANFDLSIGSTYVWFDINPPAYDDDPQVLEVGGDPYPTLPSNYLVTWRGWDATAPVHWRLINAAAGGSFVNGQQVLESNTTTSLIADPSVSKSNDGSAWNLAWFRRESSQADWALRGARIDWAGNVVSPPFVIRQYFQSNLKVAVSTCLSGTQTWLATYTDHTSGNHVRAMLINGTTPVHDADLNQLEELVYPQTGPSYITNRDEVDADTDGHSFSLTYQVRTTQFGETYIHVLTLGVVGNQLRLDERSRIVDTQCRRPAIASTFGAGLPWRLQLVVYDSGVWPTSPPTGDIKGAFYDNALYSSFCHAGYEPGNSICPCANPPLAYGRGCNNSVDSGGAKLSASGICSIGSDSMVLASQGMPLTAVTVFNQGTALVSPVPFGQGLRCVGGSIKRLYTKTAQGGVASAPGAGDASIHLRSAALGDPISAGQSRFYYVYYRDPVVLGGCPSGATYNTTQSLQAIWIP